MFQVAGPSGASRTISTSTAAAEVRWCLVAETDAGHTQAETFAKVAAAEQELKVLEKLRGFSQAVNTISENIKTGAYNLVILDTLKKQVTISGYSLDRLELAVRDYAIAKKRAKNGDPIEVVLVSAGPVDSLRRAYPNYFLDTHDFIQQVEKIIASTAKP